MQTNPDGDVVYAGFLRRWAALFLDSLILSSAFYLVFFVLLLAVGASTGFEGFDEEDPPAWLIAGYVTAVALYYVIAALYYALLESSANQATVGKMALGIKVTDTLGRRLSFTHALGRWFAAALSYLTLYIGFIVAGFTQRKQALHDVVAGTLVVDKWANSEFPERQQRELSGCLVAFLIGMAVLIVVSVLGILAAIAIPAYQDYGQRAKVSAAIGSATALKIDVAAAALSAGECPDNQSPGFLAAEAYAGPHVQRIEVGTLEDGSCGIVLWLVNEFAEDPDNAWITLFFVAPEQRWSCVSGLPDRVLPADCRG